MRISVDGSRIRNNKVAFSNLSGIVWTGPKVLGFLMCECVCVVIYSSVSWIFSKRPGKRRVCVF